MVSKSHSSCWRFEGKKILEIGGAIQYLFNWTKCKDWTSVEYKDYHLNQVHETNSNQNNEFPNYRYTDSGWEQFYQRWKSHSSKKFDVIYSVAAFEHIDNLGACLDACHAMLKNDGLLYSYFSSIWSSPNGSHGFHPNELNVLGGHSHLMFDFTSLQTYLSTKGYDAISARNSAESLYRSPQINRYSVEQLGSIFSSTNFRNKNIYAKNLKPFSDLYSPSKVAAISRHYPSMINSCDSIEMLLQK